MAKVNATENKAEATETVTPAQQIKDIYEQLGRLQLEKEKAMAVTQSITQRMRQLYEQVTALERG